MWINLDILLLFSEQQDGLAVLDCLEVRGGRAGMFGRPPQSRIRTRGRQTGQHHVVRPGQYLEQIIIFIAFLS